MKKAAAKEWRQGPRNRQKAREKERSDIVRRRRRYDGRNVPDVFPASEQVQSQVARPRLHGRGSQAGSAALKPLICLFSWLFVAPRVAAATLSRFCALARKAYVYAR